MMEIKEDLNRLVSVWIPTAHPSDGEALIVDQLHTAVVFTDLLIFNTLFSNSQGTTFNLSQGVEVVNREVTGVAVVEFSQVLSSANFSGFTRLYSIDRIGLPAFIGFRTELGNVGWFKVEMGSEKNAIRVTTGKYANEGESLVVGETIMGDLNCDESVDIDDVPIFVGLLKNGGFSPMVDFDGDGVLTLLDVLPFVNALNGG